MFRSIAIALAASAAAISAPTQAATTYDAFSSFNGTNGAGGFSWSSLPSSNMVTLLSSTACAVNNTICLGLPSGDFGLPGVFKSTGIPSTSHPFQPLDRLLVHPGSASQLLGSFNAPTAGDYSFNIVFDNLGGGAVSIFAGTNAGGSFNTLGTGFLNGVGLSQAFSGTRTLNAGQFILFGVGNGGSFINDSTGLRFTVTALGSAVPEPSAWAMMLTGFAIIGWGLRRQSGSRAKRRIVSAG